MNNFLDFYLTKERIILIMELVKENVTVNQVSCKGDTQVLVDEDIIVPDVKPEYTKNFAA